MTRHERTERWKHAAIATGSGPEIAATEDWAQ
jgi:hypothetical protein